MATAQKNIIKELTGLVVKVEEKTKYPLEKLCHLIHLYQLQEFKTYDANDLIAKVEFVLKQKDKTVEQVTFKQAKEKLLWMLDHTFSELISRRIPG